MSVIGRDERTAATPPIVRLHRGRGGRARRAHRPGTAESAGLWRNSVLLGGYHPQRIAALKDEVDGALYVSGSGTLVRALLADGLLDELHLLVYPVVLGDGARLFPDRTRRTRPQLAAQQAFDYGVLHLTDRAAED